MTDLLDNARDAGSAAVTRQGLRQAADELEGWEAAIHAVVNPTCIPNHEKAQLVERACMLIDDAVALLRDAAA